MKHKSVSQSVLLWLFIVLVFAVSSRPARATTTTWTDGGTGDWFDNGNWDHGFPDSYVDAVINNGGTAQIFHQLNNGLATAQSLILGDNQGDSGTVLIDGDYNALDVRADCERPNPGDVIVGNRGNGTLTVTNGPFVRSGRGFIAAGLDPAGTPTNGAVKLSGEYTFWLIAAIPSCRPGPGLFVGCTATTDTGGTALLQLGDGANVEVANLVEDRPGIKVGLSGTVTGNGVFILSGSAPLPNSLTMSVLGTLAPAGTLTIAGNLTLDHAATTACNVTPQASDNVQVVQQFGSRTDGAWGTATLDGRLSVIMDGTFTPAITRYTLLHADAGLTPFRKFGSVSIKYPVDQGFEPRITYDGYNVYLDLVFSIGGL